MSGTRITSRSRPRLSGYPWPLRTQKTTVAALTSETNGLTNLIGPLPMQAVMEMIFRVQDIEFDGAYSYEATGGETVDGTIEGTMGMVSTERKLFESARYKPGDAEVSTPLLEGGSIGGGGAAQMIATSNAEQYGHGSWEVFQDENGMFWLSGYIVCASGNIEIQTNGTGVTFLKLDIDLILHSGAHKIQGIALTESGPTINSASLTLTATKWFPYATKAGTPAWNTTTGAPANGGPGA